MIPPNEKEVRPRYSLLFHQIQDTPFWDMMPYSAVKLWFWLLMEVTHTGNAEKRGLEPGQLNHSIRFMCQALSWENEQLQRRITPSTHTLRKDLNALETEKMITKRATKRSATLITICKNWLYVSKKEGVDYSQSHSQSHKPKYCTVPDSTKAFKEEILKNNISSPLESPKDSTESKKSTLESDLQKLHRSPHWPYLERLTAWFYHPDQSCTPDWTDLSVRDQVAALKIAEKILRIDMKDAPGSEERLEKIVQWAVQDPFWSVNTQAIPPLRKKKDGVLKWLGLEKRMKGTSPKNDPDDFLRLLEEREKEDE